MPAARAVTILAGPAWLFVAGIDWRLPEHTWRPQAAGDRGILNRRRIVGQTRRSFCDSLVGDGVLLEQLELELADHEEDDQQAEAAARIAAAAASAAIDVAAFERRKGRRIHRRNALE
jgi:hypothetical protein